eukprot:7483859-Karenia_brevis.AAC.1
MPPRVHGIPDAIPDVFSDGSLSDAIRPYFGLASAGVWCPDRTLPPCGLELAYADDAAKTRGVGLYSKLDGYVPSSTRAELV